MAFPGQHSSQLDATPKCPSEGVDGASLTVCVDNAARVKLGQVRLHNGQHAHERVLPLILREAEENGVRDAVDNGVDRVQCRKSSWHDTVRSVGKDLGCDRRLEPHVGGGEDQDPRRGVLLVLVAVEEQERVIGVFGGDWRCGDPQMLLDDELVCVGALFPKDFRQFPRDEHSKRVNLVCCHREFKLNLNHLDDLVWWVSQVSLQRVVRDVQPFARPVLSLMVEDAV